MRFLTNAEAAALAGSDADYHRRDLFEAIARGDHPSWKLSVQVMPYADARHYRFNPFDLTKVWPHGDYPLIPVGRFTLNRMTYRHSGAQPVYAPNGGGRGWSDATGPVEDGWEVDGEVGGRIEQRVRAGVAPKPAEGMGTAAPPH